MDEQKFKDGDVLKHKTANFQMVVVNVSGIHGIYTYTCRWYDNNCKDNQPFKEDKFKEHELEVYYKETPPNPIKLG